MAKAPNNVLSDDQIVSELGALGCPFTTDLLQKFVTALAVHTHQESVAREPEIGADGKKVVPEKDGQPLLVDNPYDEAEMARKKKLSSAIARKLTMAYGANKYVAFDGAPAATAPQAVAPVVAPGPVAPVSAAATIQAPAGPVPAAPVPAAPPAK